MIWGLAAGFLLIGINSFLKSKPEPKNEYIYKEFKKYSPYYLDKRVTGLDIKSKTDKDFKESPDSFEIFHRMDKLEMEWGKKHMKLENSTLVVRDDNGTQLGTIPVKNEKQIQFVHKFFRL